jgi:membrane protease YdiL (CAAX protease family)
VERAELPLAVWLVPPLALILLPPLGQGPVGSRLAVLGAELLLGLPVWLGTPGPLRREVLPWAPLGTRWKAALALAPLLAVLHQSLHQAAQTWLPPDAAAVEHLRQALLPGSPLEAALILGSLLLAAPVCEEIFFRGLLPWLWRRHVGPRGVLWGPAALFAAAHGSLGLLPLLFLLGLALGWCRECSGSLLPGMVLHLFVNLAGWLAFSRAEGLGPFFDSAGAIVTMLTSWT